MHVLDLRGVIAIAGGSLIWKTISSVHSLGPSQDTRLEKVNEMLKVFQEGAAFHRMPPLRKSNMRSDGWAVLNGPIVKAANTRDLLPFLNSLAQRFFAGHGSYASSTRKVFLALIEMQKIFYSSGQFLEDEAKVQLRDAFLKLGRHWQNLRHLSSLEFENSWQISPKVHIAQHFPEQAELINPVFVQNHQEESLMGVVTKVWGACARGPYNNAIQKKALNRMWVGLELRMST